MDNENIKEILDGLKDKCKYIEDYGYQYKRLSLEDTETLLDYITNLQQEKEDYKSRCEKAIEYIEKLQENDDIEIWRENGYWAYILNILQNGSEDNE